MLLWGLDFLIKAYVARIEALLGRMERVRWVHLIWDLSTIMRWPLYNKELWERLGEWFMQRLKGKAGMQGIIITVGKRTLKLERKGVEWIEREVVLY